MATRLVCALLCLSLGFSVVACGQDRRVAVGGAAPHAAVTATVGSEDHSPHAGMLRYPDVSATHIVFGYANDLWLVSREGGTATRLASPPGQELFPRFSPDGSMIGFVGNYEGNRDLYVVLTAGGVATRVTHHPSSETLHDWTPAGRLLYSSSAFAGLGRQTQLLTVGAGGGLPEKLPVPYGANGAMSADGRWLAYTPHSRDHRTWKRYRGGMATDIWLFDLQTHSAEKVTDWEGTDSQPMWWGGKLYYLSDGGPAHRLNIWVYDPSNKSRRQVTKQREYDVKWPAVGPGPDGSGEIVYQNGKRLELLSLSSGESRVVEVRIPGDRPTIRARDYDAKDFIFSSGLSSTGKRAVFGARGDLWTVPAKQGSPRNLTRTPGVAERFPQWSPDGRWIAYFSDPRGEYELYVTQSDGRGETKQLTFDGQLFRFSPTWSPDSKKIAFTDKSGAMYVHDVESGETKQFDRDEWGSPARLNWASDSRWLTYAKGTENSATSAVWIYNVASGEKSQVTGGMFNDSWPTFDRKGEYLFFVSNRDFTSPQYEDVGTTFVYAETDVLLAVALREKVGSPFAAKSDEEEWKDAKKKDEEDKKGDEESGEGEGDDAAGEGEAAEKQEASGDEGGGDKQDEESKKDDKDEAKDKKKEEIQPIEIELDGFERRAIHIPVDRGSFSDLSVNDKGHLIYLRGEGRGRGRGPDGGADLKLFNLKDEEKKEKTVVEGTRGYSMSADGKKLLVRKGDKMAVVDAKAEQKLKDTLDLEAMKGRTDPREEWAQMFHEAWRIQRDYFYDPGMHGVDWEAVRRRYEPMVADCASREDLDFVIGEMISELNVGHAYVRGGGDREDPPRVLVGMLGADYAPDGGAYKITKIYEGAVWDYDARGPLSQPGVDVKEGDYLLAVNGVLLDASKDPWAAFVGLADRVVTLTVSTKPALDEDARHVVVRTLRSEADLRYRAWIERNRAYVAEKSGGKVGYIYVPNTGVDGQNNLFRQFYGQKHLEALIIDERWNGGGQIPTRFIELLNRSITNYWATRARDWTWPPDAHAGPKCMLINGLAGSGGDAFPYYFRQAKIGKLVGMRTWGGLVGISGNPQLIDSGNTSAPTFGFYETDGTWGVEGHGVDPDIEVIDDPSKMVDGGDPQLDRAIALMLEEIERNGYTPPKRPAFPDRSGMGLAEEDK